MQNHKHQPTPGYITDQGETKPTEFTIFPSLEH